MTKSRQPWHGSILLHNEKKLNWKNWIFKLRINDEIWVSPMVTVVITVPHFATFELCHIAVLAGNNTQLKGIIYSKSCIHRRGGTESLCTAVLPVKVENKTNFVELRTNNDDDIQEIHTSTKCTATIALLKRIPWQRLGSPAVFFRRIRFHLYRQVTSETHCLTRLGQLKPRNILDLLIFLNIPILVWCFRAPGSLIVEFAAPFWLYYFFSDEPQQIVIQASSHYIPWKPLMLRFRLSRQFLSWISRGREPRCCFFWHRAKFFRSAIFKDIL